MEGEVVACIRILPDDSSGLIRPFVVITSDLADVFWQPSRMASSFTSLSNHLPLIPKQLRRSTTGGFLF